MFPFRYLRCDLRSELWISSLLFPFHAPQLRVTLQVQSPERVVEETIHCLIPHGYPYKRVHLRAVVHQQSEGHVDERVLCDKVAEVSRFNTSKAWDAQIF